MRNRGIGVGHPGHSHTSTLGGWTPPELVIVMGVFTLMGGVIAAFIQPNMERLGAEIQDGTFDYALTKPVDAQLLVSVRELRVWQATDVLTGFIVIVVAVIQLQSERSLPSALVFRLVLLLDGVMIYSFWLILATATFWLVRLDSIGNFFQGIYAAGRYPIGIYPGWLRLGLTFLVPVAFAVTVPSEALTGRLDALTLLGAVGLAVCLLAVARLIWRRGLRRYSGASA